ncbi:hypothetical protein J4474_03115, partial [Candidatus Pacearchaeota archaeon]|nr:hypothetical protein [Candidatus Pacearchaeota archaeon]
MGDIEEKVGEVGFGFLSAFLRKTGSSLKSFFVKNKVGFLPEGMDYSAYQKIGQENSFKQLHFLIGDHPTLGIILAGLYISSLDKDSKIKIYRENRQKIYEKYGPLGVSIFNIVITGFIYGFIQWLTTYNLEKNPSKTELVDIYENTLRDWKESTIFVETATPQRIVSEKIYSKMSSDKNVFFVFASGNAR